MHRDNRRLVHNQGLVEAALLPCHALRTAVPNAATRGGLHCARLRARIARTPRPSAALPSRTARLPSCSTPRAVSRCAPDAPIAAVCFSRASKTQKPVPVGPLAGLCCFGVPFRFGRRRKPWPTCRCAWRCVRTAATKRAHGTAGHTRSGTLSGTKAEGTPRCSMGTLGVYR